MNENTPDADQSLNQDYGKNPDSTLLAGSAENDTGTAARFERGEIDVFNCRRAFAWCVLSAGEIQ